MDRGKIEAFKRILENATDFGWHGGVSMKEGWYYLHINGKLIWKKFEPEANSPFVKKVWPVDPTDRLCAWKIVLEGFFLGARVDRLKGLAGKWGLTFEDSIEMLARAPKEEVTDAMRGGLSSFVAHVLQMTPDAYWMKVAAHWQSKRKGNANASENLQFRGSGLRRDCQ